MKKLKLFWKPLILILIGFVAFGLVFSDFWFSFRLMLPPLSLISFMMFW